MSLLAPLFLLGLGLLALPFWLHRIQTDDPERETFASTMFLEQSQKRVRVRRQLQHLLLMLMRLLFLALLVFAFAKPVLQTNTSSAWVPNDRLHLIVVDTTASMSASSVFDDAKADVDSLINSFESGDLMQLYQFGPNLVSETDATFDKAVLRAAVDGLETAPVFGEIGNLIGALSRLDWSQPLDYQVHIVSDLQQTSLPDRYADLIPNLPASATIGFNFYPVASTNSNANWFIESVREEDNGLRVAVRGIDTPERDLDLRLKVNQGEETQAVVQMPESGRSSVFVLAIDYEVGTNDVEVSLLADDSLTADNQFHLVVDRTPPEPVLLLTENPFAPSATYLSAVMSSIGEAASTDATYRVEAVSISAFDARTLERYSWTLIDDIGSIDESLAEELRGYMESGGSVFAAAGERAATMSSLPLSGHELVSASIETDNRFQTVSRLDQSHPVINGLAGWSEVSFSRALNIQPGPEDTVLASLSNGAPLLVEHQLHQLTEPQLIEQQRRQGSLILLTSSLDNTWNDLPVKPLYVSLMAQIAVYLSTSDNLDTQMYGGDVFSLSDLSGGAAQVVDPQGNALLSLGNTSRPGTQILAQTGFYKVFSTSGETSVGVNLYPAESDLSPIDDEELSSWQDALNQQAEIDGVDAESAFLLQEYRQRDLWFVVLCAALILLILESIFANRQLALKSRGYGTRGYDKSHGHKSRDHKSHAHKSHAHKKASYGVTP